MDVTPADLESYNVKKDCQSHCGVYCTVDASFAIKQPLSYFWTEARGRVEGRIHRWLERGSVPPAAPTCPTERSPRTCSRAPAAAAAST